MAKKTPSSPLPKPEKVRKAPKVPTLVKTLKNNKEKKDQLEIKTFVKMPNRTTYRQYDTILINKDWHQGIHEIVLHLEYLIQKGIDPTIKSIKGIAPWLTLLKKGRGWVETKECIVRCYVRAWRQFSSRPLMNVTVKMLTDSLTALTRHVQPIPPWPGYKDIHRKKKSK